MTRLQVPLFRMEKKPFHWNTFWPPGGPPGVAWPGLRDHYPRHPAPRLGLPTQESNRVASHV